MRKPKIGKPRAANIGSFTLARRLPKLQLPSSAASASRLPGKPKVGRPGEDPKRDGK